MGCAQSAPAVQEFWGSASIAARVPQSTAAIGNNNAKAHMPLDPGPVHDSDVQLQLDSDVQLHVNGADELHPPQLVTKSMLVVWNRPGRPSDEEERWDTLCDLQILDTEPEEAYDRITRLCSSVFKVPIATISFVDHDRVWFKAALGLDGMTSLERDCSLCSWVVLARHPTALVVPDLQDDARFSRLPLVTAAPHARFYAGAPLVASNGHVLGSVCLVDTKPRQFSEQDTKLLAQFATLVMQQVERSQSANDASATAMLEPDEQENSLAASIAADRLGIMLCDVSNPKWPILFADSAWEVKTGLLRGLACGGNFWDLYLPLSARQVQAYTLATEQCRPFQLRVRCMPSSCSRSPADSALDGSGSSSGRARSVLMQFWSMGSGRGPLQAAAATSIPTHILNGQSGENAAAGRFYWASVVPDAPPKSPSFALRAAAAPAAPGSNSSASSSAGRGSSSGRGRGGSGGRGSSSGRGSSGDAIAASSEAHAAAGPSRAADTRAAVGTAARGGPASTSATALARAAELEVVGREPSVWGTSFVLLPDPEDEFSGIQLGNLLGRGAYGAVFRGKWKDMLVAVKVVDVAMRGQTTHAALEPLLHNRLDHPNIVKLYGISTREVEVCTEPSLGSWLQEGGVRKVEPVQQEVWMIMEFCNRGTLSDAIARGALAELGPDGMRMFGTINMRRLVTTLREIASAMAYMHEQNVLHGDLTGNNVMLVTDRTQRKGFAPKVGDFGLSRLIDEDQQRINTRTHGTITHMAPEVIMSGTHSRKADVYSFGIIMLEAYIGECPFKGMHYAQVVQAVTSGEPLPIPEDAPPELKALMQETTSQHPDDRPSFQEIHERLCTLEAAIKKADAGRPRPPKRAPEPVEPPSPARATMPLAVCPEFSPVADSGPNAAFDTVQGLFSEANMLNGAVGVEEGTGVESFT